MKKSRFSEEQIIAVLKEHQAGIAVADICRKHGISDATYYNWKSKYGGMEVSDAKRRKPVRVVESRAKNGHRVPHRLTMRSQRTLVHPDGAQVPTGLRALFPL